jgi:hypothetical protein
MMAGPDLTRAPPASHVAVRARHAGLHSDLVSGSGGRTVYGGVQHVMGS